MSSKRQLLKQKLLATLGEKSDQKMPTTSVGRLGRMGLSALRGGALVLKSKKGADGSEVELDPEKLVKLVTSVGQLKGIAMKMGQIMSYIDVAMPKEMQDALSVLQTNAQPMSFETVSSIVQNELGDIGQRLLATMEPNPISAASIGQVHRATLDDGTRVAVKIQYPEMEKAIGSDFGPASVGTRMASLFYPGAKVDNFVKEAKERFLEECDYLHEAHCQNEFARIFAHHSVISVPAVHGEYCSKRVLTSTFVDGNSFDDYLESNSSQEERNQIGKALFEFYIGSLFQNQIYNCDPHPGNYLFGSDGRITMLDHGCTRQFETGFVAKLANLTRAVHLDDRQKLHRALVELQIVREGKNYDYETIRGFLRSFYGPMLLNQVSTVNMEAAMEMRDIFKKKQQLLKFSLPGEFTFLFRIRFGMMSVLHRLGAKANWYQLEKQYVDDFADRHPLLS